MQSINVSLNARVAAVAFPLGAVGLHVLNQLPVSLLPARLIVIALLVFGVWAFSDEMGLRKPLNRAAFVSFIFSVGALLALTLESNTLQGRYVLIYCFGLLFSVVIWSLAFLHRQRSLKMIGSFGLVAGLLPVLILIGGHLSVGFGALFGVAVMFELSQGATMLGTTQVNLIEALFVTWSLFAAVCLWTGRIN